MWTPHDITVLLHHHCCVGPWPKGDTDAYLKSRQKLYDLGLIDRADAMAASTDKGRALIEMWRNQPVPVAQYVDPRFSDEAESALSDALGKPGFAETGGFAS